MRRSMGVAGLLGALAMAALAAGPGLTAGTAAAGTAAAVTPALTGNGPMVRAAGAGQALPVRAGTVESLNWAGYVVTPPGGGVTEVTSVFTVPSAGLLPPGFAATWTGIGGYTTPDLIQAGVGEGSLPSLPILGPQYYAWYELLPNSETPITNCKGDPSCAVSPGDRIGIVIHKLSGNSWVIAMADDGHWTWHTQVTYASSGSSAEWILEAPQVMGLQSLVAPVSTVSFGPRSSYVAGGVEHSLADGHPTTIDQTAGALPEATPSAIAPGGQSFDVCTYATSCPAP
jgi:hypothetical protein